MVFPIIMIITAAIILIIGILQSYAAKRKEKTFWGSRRVAFILIFLAVINVSASIYTVCLEYEKSKLLESRESEKLKQIAYRSQDAIDPIISFLSSYLSANGLDKPLTIFNENHEDEPGKDRPAGYLMNPIIDVFSKSSLFKPSNTWIKGR